MSTQTLTYTETDTEPMVATHAATPGRPSGHPGTLMALRALAALALTASAYLHLKLALENGLGGTPFTLSQLFVGQAAACIAAVLLLAVRDRELFWLAALAVGIGSTVPLLASVYFPLPAIGPMPPINEPVWYGEKVLSLAVGSAVPLLWLIRRIAPPAG
jgi:hypothetical protein